MKSQDAHQNAHYRARQQGRAGIRQGSRATQRRIVALAVTAGLTLGGAVAGTTAAAVVPASTSAGAPASAKESSAAAKLDPSPTSGGVVNATDELIYQAQGAGNVAALTFDDGPNPGETDELLDYLAANHLRAVFCVIGQNIEAPGGAELLRRIVDEGHVLCNHTTGYADMGDWTDEQIRADLTENLRIIRDALGDPDAVVPYFRAPNGSWGGTPQVAAEMGMQPLDVRNVIFDWATQDQAELEAALRTALVPGELVLAHDGGGDRHGTVAAVKNVVTEYLDAGWSFTLPVGAHAGEAVEVDLSGLEPGQHVELSLTRGSESAASARADRRGDSGGEGESDVVARTVADGAGNISATIMTPADAQPGRYTVLALDGGDVVGAAPVHVGG